MSFKVHPGFVSVFAILVVSYVLYSIVVPQKSQIEPQPQDSQIMSQIQKIGTNQVYDSSLSINNETFNISYPKDWVSQEIRNSQVVGEIPDLKQGWLLKSAQGLDFIELFLVESSENTEVSELLDCQSKSTQPCQSIEIDSQIFTVFSVDNVFGSLSSLVTEKDGFIYLIIASDFEKSGTVANILSSIQFSN